MTASTQLLVDAFNRIPQIARGAVKGLTQQQLGARLDPDANSVGWLVWHLARVQDAQLAEVAGLEEVWTAGGWHERFGLPFSPEDTGYGHSSSDVDAVGAVAVELLLGYLDAAHAQSLGYLETLDDAALDRVVDEGWNPPVTLGVRLVSIVADDLEHAGQAAFIRGVLLRR
jgi:hypothetical protein